MVGLNKVKSEGKKGKSTISPRILIELQRKNLEKLMKKRERMNHTNVDGVFYDQNRQNAVDLRK